MLVIIKRGPLEVSHMASIVEFSSPNIDPNI